MPPPARRSFRPVGVLTPAVEVTAGSLSAAVFGVASAVRRARVFHPDGVACTGTVEVSADGVLPSGRHDAIVRFSRGVGLPERLPDILGMAVRLPDLHGVGEHQDLLLVTSGSAPGLRHALVPVTSFDHPRWSTLLPYEVDGRRIVVGARPVHVDAATSTLDAVRAAAGAGRLRFSLEVAGVTGPWEPVATLAVDGLLPDDLAESLRFNPANTGGRLRPVGVLQTIRRRAYRGSQATRPTPTPGSLTPGSS